MSDGRVVEKSSQSGFIRTVLGDIPPRDLGITHAHEHTFILPGPSAEVNASLLLDDPAKAEAELTAFRAAGGRALVDAQPIGPERAPRRQRNLSRRTGVHVIATTGLHRACFYPENHFRFTDSAEVLADRFVTEIVDGMLAYSPSGETVPTEIPAGLVKFATEYHVIDALAEKAARGAALAHLRTGAPILTHSEYGTCAMQQIALMESCGVDPTSLLISHLDRNPDIYLHQDVASAGTWLIYDGIARTKYYPDSTIVDLIVKMMDAGFGSRILLAMDMGPRTMWKSYGGGPGMDYLVRAFLPKLLQAGLDERAVAQLTTANPAAALAFALPSGGTE